MTKCESTTKGGQDMFDIGKTNVSLLSCCDPSRDALSAILATRLVVNFIFDHGVSVPKDDGLMALRTVRRLSRRIVDVARVRRKLVVYKGLRCGQEGEWL